MNIFLLDMDPAACAQAHFDRHIVKMPLELAQMLSTAAVARGDRSMPYRGTHKNHPMTKWVGASRQNFEFTIRLGLALCDEYKYRYARTHACQRVIHMAQDLPSSLWAGDESDATEFPQVMPEVLRIPGNPVEAYRTLYVFGKAERMRCWKRRDPPAWFPEIAERYAERGFERVS